jgi:hypothetical protein
MFEDLDIGLNHYLAHVLETAGHKGPGIRASGCHVRQ